MAEEQVKNRLEQDSMEKSSRLHEVALGSAFLDNYDHRTCFFGTVIEIIRQYL